MATLGSQRVRFGRFEEGRIGESICLSAGGWRREIRIRELTEIWMDGYSCFNAFSRVDVRVEVKIPGGVDGELESSFLLLLSSL